MHRSGWGAATVGIADALVGVGAAVGAAFAIKFRSSQPARTGLLILVGQAAAIAVIGVSNRPLLFVATTVIGVTAGLASAQLSGAFQQLVEPAYLGRMGALTSLGDDVLMPAAMVGFGALAGEWGCPHLPGHRARLRRAGRLGAGPASSSGGGLCRRAVSPGTR